LEKERDYFMTNEIKNAPNVSIKDAPETRLTKLSFHYSNAFPLRALIQGIPILGGALDTMLSGLGSKWQTERFENYIKLLEERLARLERNQGPVKVDPSEPLYDLIIQTFDYVLKTRSEEKRSGFANIVANQLIKKTDWAEAETASRLLNDLTDIHVQILLASLGLKRPPGFTHMVKSVTISNKYNDAESVDLRTLIPGTSVMAIRLACSELVARGLLHDDGVGRAGVGTMEYLAATELTSWFVDWIKDSTI
jgi:hypothetical protein